MHPAPIEHTRPVPIHGTSPRDNVISHECARNIYSYGSRIMSPVGRVASTAPLATTFVSLLQRIDVVDFKHGPWA